MIPQHKLNDYYPGNKLQLIHSGAEYFDHLELLIRNAVEEIHMQFYIFNDDNAGLRIANALIQAAGRGVSIFLLIDGYESLSLSRHFINSLSIPNIHLQYFEPLLKSSHFYIGRRLHHKIAVFDQRIALVGGINIADRYMGSVDEPAWLDLAVQIEGMGVTGVLTVCITYWNDVTGQSLQQKHQQQFTEMNAPGQCSLRVRRNDWVKNKNQIWKSYFELFNQANESIVIMCSYFLPGWTFLGQIKKAIARGVQVQVILAGISDVMLAKHAERYLYRWMLRNGVEVYEYSGSVLHAKIGIRDDKWLTIGSYNVNNISAFASIELNVDIRNQPFVSQVRSELQQIMDEKCTRITDTHFYASQNALKQLWQWCCYQLIKIVLYLATFYFRQER